MLKTPNIYELCQEALVLYTTRRTAARHTAGTPTTGSATHPQGLSAGKLWQPERKLQSDAELGRAEAFFIEMPPVRQVVSSAFSSGHDCVGARLRPGPIAHVP